jgi:3-methyl-2-oxobutanoate hydroxymethyltransferase
MKKNGEKIVALTAYDAPTAKILNEAEIDLILVGDSVANVKLGYENTIPVTVDEMLHHTRAVRRGNRSALLVADLPYLSYQLSVDEAKRNAGRFLKEGGAEAVKIEGGQEIAAAVKALADMSVPVMGHLGLTPQSVHKLGGYRLQGKTPQAAERIVTDAKILEGAGAFAIVLECIPPDLAREITQKVSIPTIGIGAGPHCDGQILVIDDLLGLTEPPVPQFVKAYASLRKETLRAVRQFRDEVRDKKFPEVPSSRPAPGAKLPGKP